jgi:hypothetical protein
MDDAIQKAIADLSALIGDADSKDAECIREIIERLQNFDAQMLMLARASVMLCNPQASADPPPAPQASLIPHGF